MQHANLPDAGRVSHFQIDGQLPTPAEKAALAGDPVPPGDANRYLTQNHAAGGFDGFANPSASVGLVAANGVATTAMRSDAAPALDQSITPTWVGLHTFGAGLAVCAGQGVTMADDAWIGIGAALERIIFDAAGDIAFMGCDVGIGTTVPAWKTHIHGTTDTYLAITAASGGGLDTGVLFSESGPTGNLHGALIYDGANNFLDFKTGAAATPGGLSSRMVIERNTGNVGIGTTAPLARLHVDQFSDAGAIPVVTMDQADIDVVLFKVIAAAAAAGVDYTLVADSDYGTPGALVGWIQIEIDDVGNRIADGDYYIPFYAAPS